MSYTQFRIPKQKDRTLVEAMIAIRDGLKELRSLSIQVTPYYNGQEIKLPDLEWDGGPALGFIFKEDSEIMPQFRLSDPTGNRTVMRIERQLDQILDLVVFDSGNSFNDWSNALPQATKPQTVVKLMSLARTHLRAQDAEANFSSVADSEWSRYRNAQQSILNSLQETQKTVLADFSRKSLETEAALRAKYDKLETDLREHCQIVERNLQEENTLRVAAIEARDAAIKKREESFNTKEARYVARQEQQNQIAQLKDWLEGWSLTSGTRSKRWWVVGAYAVGTLATGFLAVWFSIQNVDILKGKDFAQVAWWQWLLLSLKSIIPVTAFITFVIYFIRWSATWARQHAEEEFRNRARVLDIGRTAWLLEAVRDAQDNQKELPPELLKELSRNLFTYAPLTESDVQPQAFIESLLQGLASIRLKSPDGTELEASRAKSK